MTCRELIDFLADYLEGKLPADQRQQFDQHLCDCNECVDYLHTYETTIRCCREVLADEPGKGTCKPPPPLPEALVQAILAAAKRP